MRKKGPETLKSLLEAPGMLQGKNWSLNSGRSNLLISSVDPVNKTFGF